jgi:hypothetical protein
MPPFPDPPEQLYVVVTEEALGLPVSDRATLVALVEELPFELAMILVSRLQGELAHIRTDTQAQFELASVIYEDAGTLNGIVAFLNGGPRRVVFSEQNLTALQRVLVLHARDDAGVNDITPGEIERAKRALLAVPSVVEAAETRLRNDAQLNEDAAWAYTMQNGAYNNTEPPLNRLVRTYMQFVEIFEATSDHADFCPLDEWFAADYGVSAVEQYAAGYGLHAASRALDETRNLLGRGVVDPPTNSALFRDKREQIEQLLVGTRDWYAERFAALGDNDRALAWERTPFMQRPFLNYSDGRWRLLLPRALDSWLSDGFYHRGLASAQRRDREEQNERSENTLRYTRYFGHLAERYTLRLAQSVYDDVAGVAVSGEQVYSARGSEMRTSDVAVAFPRDLVLIEVVSARLNREMQVEGDPVLLASVLERMVHKKGRQLARVIRDVRAGAAAVPGLDIEELERVWPVIVTAGGTLFQTDLLWNRIDARLPPDLDEPPVQPLTLFDVEDLETALGHVPLGFNLAELLAWKTADQYRRREFVAFQHDVLQTPNTTRPPLLEERFAELGALLAETLQLDPEEPGE